MADHEGSTKHGRKRIFSFLFLLVSSVVVLVGIVLISLRGHMEGAPSTEKDQIIITNSGSTNTPGSTLTINSDGSGSLHYKRSPLHFGIYTDKTFAAHTLPSNQFQALIAEIKGVRAIPNHGCPKSISFGSAITITYRGETSGDISCLSMQDGKVLYDLRALVMSTYALIMHQKRNTDM